MEKNENVKILETELDNARKEIARLDVTYVDHCSECDFECGRGDKEAMNRHWQEKHSSIELTGLEMVHLETFFGMIIHKVYKELIGERCWIVIRGKKAMTKAKGIFAYDIHVIMHESTFQVILKEIEKDKT